MADDSNKLSIKDFIEDDGTLDGLIRQLGDIIGLVDMLEKMLKKDDVAKWTKGLQQGSLDYKIALQEATSLAEKLVATSTKLTEVRMAETKELARLEQLIKDENRERQREAEINSKAAGSYARMKLELKQLIDQYKEAGTVEGKVKIAGEMSRLSSNIMLADRQLKLMLNDYSKLTGAQKQVLAETERQIAASNAATKAVRDRAAAEAKLKTKASQSADSSAEERVNAALKKRIAIESELNALSDAEANKSLSSADIIQKRIALKQQLASIDGEVKQLEAELTMEQKVVAAQEKLNNLRRAATTNTESGRSQLEEVKYEEQLASAIQKTAAVRAEAAVMGTQEYQEMVQAQQELKKSQLEVAAGFKLEDMSLISVDGHVATLEGTYEQLEARYKLVEQAMRSVDQSTNAGKVAFKQYGDILDGLALSLDGMERKLGITSSRMSSRQRQWDGLTNSVYQLTRELPNLAVRADTFFLAISNNIPIFIDELRRAKLEMGSLAAAAKKAGIAFAKALPLALILLVLSRWSDLVNIVDKLFNTLEDGTLKTGAFYRALEKQVTNATTAISKQVYAVRSLAIEWKKLTSENAKIDFLARYRAEIEKTGLAVVDLNSAEKVFGEFTDTIVEAYIARMKAAAAAALAEEDYKKAVESAFKVEKRASTILGRDVSEQDLRRMFAEQYGITDSNQIVSGKFSFTKDMLAKLIKDYRSALGITNIDLMWDNSIGKVYASSTLKGGLFAGGTPKEFEYLVEAYNNMKPEDIVEITKDIAEWMAVANESGDGSKSLRNALRDMISSFAQGDQAMKKSTDYLHDEKEALGEVGVAATDLQKRLDSLYLSSIRALNNSRMALHNIESYLKGGRSGLLYRPIYSEDGSYTLGIDQSSSFKVQNSFDKKRLEANQEMYMSYFDLIDKIRDAERKLNDATDESEKAIINTSIQNYKTAISLLPDIYKDSIKQIDREENSAYARLYADNIANRLAAAKKGTEEEHALRIRSIRANMNAEIAENATLEPALRKSVSAIRDKYRKEEEDEEREWLIKCNNWRKQQLENENAAELSLTLDYYNRRRQIQQIELENELLENAELIESGQIKQEDIIRKNLKAQEKLWREHRSAVLSSQKSMWDIVEELAQTDSYEQLAAKLNKYDIELEQTKIQQQEILDLQIPNELKRIAEEQKSLNDMLESNNELSEEDIAFINDRLDGLAKEASSWEILQKEIEDYLGLLEQANKKRKQQAINQRLLNIKQREQDIQSIGFYSQFQVGERQGESFELQQQIDMLKLQIELEQKLMAESEENSDEWARANSQLMLYIAQLNEATYKKEKLNGVSGTISAVASHGLAGLVRLQQKDANGNTIKNKQGKVQWKDLSSGQYDALNTALSSVKSSLNEVMQAYVDVAQAAYDAAQAQVDAARTVYETELEARANGYANDVDGAKRELALEKQKAKQKEAILKQAQRAQEAVNTALQISSLITASAQILKYFGAFPAVAGVLLAAMWGMFAMAKIKAAQVASQSSTYGEGGFELAVGGSHASGHDIHTNIQTKSGRNMVIEGGEGVGVFSRKAVSKYGNAIPQLVDAINDGSLSDLGYSPSDVLNGMAYEDLGAVRGSQYAKEILSLQPLTNRVDLTTVEGLLSIIISKQVGQPVVLPDGSIFERKGNKTTITRRN